MWGDALAGNPKRHQNYTFMPNSLASGLSSTAAADGGCADLVTLTAVHRRIIEKYFG
jgi:hypothetical protein